MKAKALLIGINDYQNIRKLETPLNDIGEMKNVFEQLGITVTEKLDISKQTFDLAFPDFLSSINEEDAIIFYFAGHGGQYYGKNYLLPKDVNNSTPDHLIQSAIKLDDVIEGFERSNVGIKIIILDACRSPLHAINKRGEEEIGFTSFEAPFGTFIAFSTSPKKGADDVYADTGHSPFAYSLLHHIKEKDVPIESLFKKTRNTLYSITERKQLSWEHSCLLGDFYFSRSQITGEYLSDYSSEALQDELYNYNLNETPVQQLIWKLRTHSAKPQQNAINSISSTDFSNVSKDELFILGRNMYQSLTAGITGVIIYFKKIKANLDYFEKEVAFHILNGILYEIYFNKKNELRNSFKLTTTDYYNNTVEIANQVFSLFLYPEYEKSAYFIMDKLNQNNTRFFYDHVKRPIMELKLYFSKLSNSKTYIEKIEYEGINILKNRRPNFDPESLSCYAEKPIEQLKKEITEMLVAPKDKIIFKEINLLSGTEHALFDYEFAILKK